MYSGYIQVQDPEYQKEKTINQTFTLSKASFDSIADTKHVTNAAPRLESFSLMSYKNNTQGGALIGIDPERENNITNLSQWVTEGNFLDQGDDGILLATNLAKTLNVDIGDTLVLISQGYHGASAAGLFPVRGILKFPSPELNNFGGYTSLQKAQQFYTAYERLTSVVVMVDDYEHVSEVNSQLAKFLKPRYESLTWKELQPELVQFIEGDRASGVIIKAVLYIVIGFGILGTVIMMLAERWRELGVMVAVGMKRWKLSMVLVYETIFIGIVGVISGFIISVPIVFFLTHNPIELTGEIAQVYENFGIEPLIYFDNRLTVFTNQLLTVFVITCVVSLYPLIRILRMKAIEAVRS
jgi:ABC-type lipoprotein release transport system permease subunit